MRRISTHLIIPAMAASLLTPAAYAAPSIAGVQPAAPQSQVENAGYRGHGRGYRGYGHHRGGIGAGAIIGGLVAGALIAGAVRESRASSSDFDRCADSYGSFDARTGTYLGYDGVRHVCPYLE